MTFISKLPTRAAQAFCLALFVSVFLCSNLIAQTAHYVGVQTVLYQPSTQIYFGGIAVDGAGAAYFSDTQGGRILKLVPAGQACAGLTVIASGLTNPVGVAVNSVATLYTADNSRVLKLTQNGCSYTQTVIDTQVQGTYGVALDSSGNVYIADFGNHRIVKETVSGSTFVHSNIITGLTYPYGVAVYGTTVLVADSTNGTLQKFTLSGSTYSAGQTVVSGLGSVGTIALDAAGDVFVPSNDGVVHKAILSGGNYTDSFFGFQTSESVAVDNAGNVYSSDDSNFRVLKISPVAPSFSSPVGTPSSPIAAIFEVDKAGDVNIHIQEQGVIGLEFNAPTNNAYLCCTNAGSNAGDQIEVDLTFSPLFAGTRAGVAQLTSDSGAVLAATGVSGVGVAPQAAFYPGSQSLPFAQASLDPEGLAIDVSGNIFIGDAANNRVLKETPSYGDYNVTAVGTGLSSPEGLALDGAGNLYIADTGSGRILKETLAASTYTQSVVTSTGHHPNRVAVDGKGVVYFSDEAYGVFAAKPNAAGAYVVSTIGTSATAPTGLAVDSNGYLYIADISQGKVLRGTYLGGLYFEQTVGSGYTYPNAVAVDGLGNFAVADSTANSRVLEDVTTSRGYTELLAGSGFAYANALAIDQEGNLYVGDKVNQRVVKISVSGAQSLSFTNTIVGTTSPGQTIAFANIGNAPLNFPNYSSGNPYFDKPNFVFDSNTTCPTNLQGQSLFASTVCNYVIDFAPSTTTGFYTGSLTLIDTSRNVNYSVQGVEFSGTAILGSKTISFPQPASPMLQNSTDTLTATTSNGDPVTYAITAGTATLNGNMIAYTTTGTVTITASSAATATYSAATPVSASVMVQVSNGTQNVSWLPSTLSIYTGAALGTGVLDATDSVAAGITYTSQLRPNGSTQTANPNTVLAMGKYLLTAIVTPNNTAYAVTTTSLPFTVQNMNPFVSNSNGTVSSLYNNGSAQSSSVSGGGVGAAVDSGGFVWSLVSAGDALAQYTDTGMLSATYSNIGLTGAKALAIDGLGQVWVANNNGTVGTVSNAGLALLTTTDPGFSGPTAVAIDMSGNVWVSSATNNSVEQIIGGAAPVAPLANAVLNLAPATRP